MFVDVKEEDGRGGYAKASSLNVLPYYPYVNLQPESNLFDQQTIVSVYR